jgi:hypothetical protein
VGPTTFFFLFKSAKKVLYFHDFHDYPCLFLLVSAHLPFFYLSFLSFLLNRFFSCIESLILYYTNATILYHFGIHSQFPSAIFSFILHYLSLIIKDQVKIWNVIHFGILVWIFLICMKLYKYQVW